MSVLYVLIPLAIAMVIGFVWAYAWSTRTGQFDDLTTPAMRILHEDPAPREGHSGSPPRRSPPE